MRCLRQFEHCFNFNMEYIVQFTAVAVLGAVLSLVIRKNNPELSLLIGVGIAVMGLLGLAEMLTQLGEKLRAWEQGSLLSAEYYAPMLKCLSIAMVTQLGVGVCKDAGQSAAAAILELAGTISSAWCVLPLVLHLFELIEDML